MLRFALTSFLSTPFANAECTLSSFEDGQVASAEEINCNFQVLESEISTLSGSISSGQAKVVKSITNPAPIGSMITYPEGLSVSTHLEQCKVPS